MNFKFTWLKGIISIIVGFLMVDVFVIPVFFCSLSPFATEKGCSFNFTAVIGWIISILLIYIIWSLFQKKK